MPPPPLVSIPHPALPRVPHRRESRATGPARAGTLERRAANGRALITTHTCSSRDSGTKEPCCSPTEGEQDHAPHSLSTVLAVQHRGSWQVFPKAPSLLLLLLRLPAQTNT